MQGKSDFADDLPIVTGDRIDLQYVLLNLIRNALDATVDVDCVLTRPMRPVGSTMSMPGGRQHVRRCTSWYEAWRSAE